MVTVVFWGIKLRLAVDHSAHSQPLTRLAAMTSHAGPAQRMEPSPLPPTSPNLGHLPIATSSSHTAIIRLLRVYVKEFNRLHS